MVLVSICIGSSCHLKGSEQLVELFENKIKAENLSDQVMLYGSFCLGKCNRIGVTVSIGDGTTEHVFTGVTPNSFPEFWLKNVAPKIQK